MNDDDLDLDFDNSEDDNIDLEISTSKADMTTDDRRRVEAKLEEVRIQRMLQDYDFA